MATTTFRKPWVSRELLAAVAAVGVAYLLGGATGYVARQGVSQPVGASTRNAVQAPAPVTHSIDRSAVRRLGAAAPGFADPVQAPGSGASRSVFHEPGSRLGGSKI
jgi:hypothetical protein